MNNIKTNKGRVSMSLLIKNLDDALKIINRKVKVKIDSLELQQILREEYGYTDKENTKLINLNLSKDKIIEIYYKSNFKKSEILKTLKFKESILPPGVPGRLDEKQVKVKNEIWRIHKSDPDTRPSNPHAHNIQTGYKLHLGNGQLFDSKCKPLNCKISKKHLLAIRDELTEFVLPELSI